MIIIREPAKTEIEEMHLLRWSIHRKPFGLPQGTERDEKEDGAHTVIAFDDALGKIIGSARLTISTPCPDKIGEISFVGVQDVHRFQGIGMKMMKHLHQKAKDLGVQLIKLNARKSAEPFYHKLGYKSIKDFLSGPPHSAHEVHMRCKLR